MENDNDDEVEKRYFGTTAINVDSWQQQDKRLFTGDLDT